MNNRRVDVSQSGKVWMVLAGFAVLLYVLWDLSNSIAAGSSKFALLLGAVFVAFFVAGRIAGNWRSGVYLFFGWLLFEDLIRKYMGNSMYVYFVKDVLVAVVYFSFLSDRSRRASAVFRPPFIHAFGLLLILGLVQVFNPLSPSVFYGLLGLKLYFYYVPLMFIGYAMLRDAEDLRRLLVVTMGFAGAIAMVGIVQAVVGLNFLNPLGGAEIDELGHTVRYTPSGLAVARIPSVFVSDGRFGQYLILAFIIGMGTGGYLLLRNSRGRKIALAAVGLVALAGVLSGSRGVFLYIGASALVLSAAMLWGAPPSLGGGYRLVKAIRRSFVLIALGVSLGLLLFPGVIGARLAFYQETVMPGSETFEAGTRVWAYPLANLLYAFASPDWVTGHGIGTASLGVQYVSHILGVPASYVEVENGYGSILLELGILGLILWVVWATSLVVAASATALKLKGTWAFPVALSITWYVFLMLFPFTWGSFVAYQNFVCNAYLWLLIGVLFRLPELVRQESVQIVATHA